MGRTLLITAGAAADLVDIGEYLISQAGEAIAARFIGELGSKLRWIAESGTTGVPRDNLSQGLKALNFKGRNIYFRVTADECRIVRVIHASRDLDQQEFDDDGAAPNAALR